jgi:uncharacterized protein with PQ loop repeat
LLQDEWIFFANAPGLLLSTFYILSAVTALSAVASQRNIRTSNALQLYFVAGIAFWVLVGVYCAKTYTGEHGREKSASIIGAYSSTFCILYYAAPLSTAMEAIERRDARSLHMPMIAVNLVNSSLWFTYGYIAIHQYQIWLPNIVGAILALSQLVLLSFLSNRGGATSALYQPINAREPPLPVIPHFVPSNTTGPTMVQPTKH